MESRFRIAEVNDLAVDTLIPLFRQGNYDRAAETGVNAIAAILESDLRRPQPRQGGGT